MPAALAALTPADQIVPCSAPIVAPATLRRRAAGAFRWAAWLASGALTLGFLSYPVSTDAQMWLCGGAFAGMVATWLVAPRRGLPRMLVLSLGSLVVLRYLYWRFSQTLPSLDDPVGFGLGLLLLAAEMYCVMILAVSLIINADPLERPATAILPDAELPTVDIFIPTYNEDAEILATTVAAARLIDYPGDKFTVWLLDDGGSDQKCADADPEKAAAAQARRAELQALCADLGARYLTRARNEHAKAGNLNNGLKSASGEIVVVLDADHAPFRSFLKETVGHFAADPRLFLVQTPHIFLNPDPIERNLRTFERMPSENEMFYSVTQRGLDKWNGSFFCGSAALLRRAALDEVGGFSGVTITEDCETAFELHARGWTSVFVDKPLIAGLQPETFAAFIGQRARWCQGMFQIMLLKNPLLKPGLKPIQRLAYLSSMTFWFFPIPRLAFMLAPLLHIFFDVKIFVSSFDEAIAFTAMYVVANMMLQNYLYGHVRWPWVSELYEYAQGVFLVRSIVSVVISPRRPSFNVTAKGLTLEEDHLSALAKPFFAIYLALAAGCAYATWRYLFEPGVTDLMLVVGLWCLFNLVIAGAALGAAAERRQLERAPSLGIARLGAVTAGSETFPVAIERISSAGCSLRRSDGEPWPVGRAEATLVGQGLDGEPLGALPLSVTSNPGEARACTFAGLAPRDYRSVADLMYGDAAPLRAFLARRRKPMNLFLGSARFLVWGLGEPLRAFTYAVHALRKDAAAVPVAAQPATPQIAALAAIGPVAVVPLTPAQLVPAAPRKSLALVPVSLDLSDELNFIEAVTIAPPVAAVPVLTMPGGDLLRAAEFLAPVAARPAARPTEAPAIGAVWKWRKPVVTDGWHASAVVEIAAAPAAVLQRDAAVPQAAFDAGSPASTPLSAETAGSPNGEDQRAPIDGVSWMEALAALCRSEIRAIEAEEVEAFDPTRWIACMLELAETETQGSPPGGRPVERLLGPLAAPLRSVAEASASRTRRAA